MHNHPTLSVPKVFAGLVASLCLSGLSSVAQPIDVPSSSAINPPVDYPGGSLKGEYWKRTPNTIFTDGATVDAHRIDTQINGFGAPSGTFRATKFVYLGNDLSPVPTWLSDDAPSYSGIASNLDDGAFRFSGYINIASAGVLNIGTTSDDGVRIKIGGVDIVNNDGSHGDVTKDQDVNFASAGLYPIEITYFNGDWTSDGNNHSGSTDPGLHGGANFHLRMGSADVTSAGTAMLHPVAPLPLTSIGLNFGADEVTSNSGKPTALAPTDVAGAVPQANWNNLNGASGTASSGIAANQGGTAVATTISVEWTCPNTWSTTGRGEENNGFPDPSPDRALMTGYLDTGNGAGNTATVTVSGIPADFTAGGYDVLVYCNGGVVGRGGAYTIGGETKYGTTPANPSVHVEDPGVDLTDTGTYVRFRGVYTSSFTLTASADAALPGNLVNFRAPINGIQIVKNQNPKAGLAVGYLTKHSYYNIGTSVNLVDLLTNPKYLNDQFDFSCLRTDFSANDNDECDQCGHIVRGFFIPKVTGEHTFYIATDDGGGLFLSTDDNPANKVQIASEPAWSARRRYIDNTGSNGGDSRGDPPVNRSVPINLVAGSLYYIEGDVKENGGGDNLDVAVQGPGDPAVQDGDRPISGDRIATIVDLTGSSLAITQNPASIRVPEGDEATFSVAVTANSPLCGGITTYQWQRNGADIAGADNATYSFGPVHPEDHLATFRCRVRIPGIERISTSATLEVLGRECLRVVGAVGSGSLTNATVQFGTFLSTDTSTTDPFNYSITGPGGTTLAVSGVVLSGDGKSVILTTDQQAENTDYTISVQNVMSIVGSAVCEAPTNSATFRSWVTDPCGGVLFEAFNTGGGNTVSILTSHPDFPNNPDAAGVIGAFESRLFYPDNSREGYGARMRGLFIPPSSGNWVFYLASDDSSQLFLNPTGPNAAGKIKIQEELGCCGAYTGHRSAPYPLVGGQGYYIEALYKEGTGGDYCRVFAGLDSEPPPPGGNPDPPASPSIPGAWLGYPAAPQGIGGTLSITQQPADASVSANTPVNFSVVASNPNDLPVCYQWRRDGTAIPGATRASYSFIASLSDNGSTFDCTVAIIGSHTVTRVATLMVTEDVTPPSCVSAVAALSLSNIVVRFSEFIDPQTAVDPFNFTVAGFTVVSATPNADRTSVTVTLDGALTIGGSYSIVIQSITDLAGNTISPNPCTLNFKAPVVSCGFARADLFLGLSTSDVTVAALRSAPNYPNSPDLVRYKGLLELNTFDEFEGYGARISGWLIPPVSGNYNFFMSSDDNGEFWLSTDANPANIVLIANEPVWNARRDWLGTDRRNATAPENRSTTLFPGGIPLVASQMYYFEALFKEGGGGDNLGVAWQKPGDPLPPIGSTPIPGVYMAALASPVGASLTITQQPTGQSVEENKQASFSVAVDAQVGGAATQDVFYQWYRMDPGGAFAPIGGANSATYTPLVTLADNGSKYRVAIYVPGATVTSAEVSLEVYHINTPPTFTCGPNQTVAAGAGAQTVTGWATGIQPHSITRTPVTFSTTFDSLSALETLYGSPAPEGRLEDGVLKLTDAGTNSAFGAWVLTTPSVTRYETFSANWKSRIGGGSGGGADGYSLNVADDITNPPIYGDPGEEGSGSGLSVTVDTFDNGGGEVGLEIRWQKQRVTFLPIPKDDDGTGNYLRKDTFVNASVSVDATGMATFTYDGNTITAQIPGYGGIRANQVAIGGRTGGANDNHWIDDLNIQAFPFDSSSAENGQTVQFLVTSDKPGLFAVQPAVSANGTLTYTPAANGNGVASVTVVAKDSGGTAFGGNDTSTPCTFTITLTGGTQNHCPVASPLSVVVDQDSHVDFHLPASDADGDALQFNVTQAPAHGIVVVQVQTGAASYSPSPGYSGPDSFSFSVSDGQCTSPSAVVNITVRPAGANHPPIARIEASPLADFSPLVANKVLISDNGSNACLNLDGSLSTDVETPTSQLTFAWFDSPSPLAFANGAVVTSCFELGTHTIVLVVTDPQGATGSASLTIEVLTAGESIDVLITAVDQATLDRKTKRPFIATLKAAGASADRGQNIAAANQLHAFQNKVRAQIAPSNAQLADELIKMAQAIIDALK